MNPGARTRDLQQRKRSSEGNPERRAGSLDANLGEIFATTQTEDAAELQAPLETMPARHMPNVEIGIAHDWDFAISRPVPKGYGQIKVSLEFRGRGKPDPVEWETPSE